MLDTATELGGVLLGFLLTLAILSFVIKDNPLYRLAVHMLVGVSAGFAVVIAVRDVFKPLFETLIGDSTTSTRLFWIIPLLLALSLLLKAFPRTAWLGNSAMAVLVAVGAAVGLAGAIAGTLVPQVMVSYEDALRGVIVALLAALVLTYFFFNARLSKDGDTMMPKWYPYLAVGGRAVITITLAGLFVGALNTSLVLLTERLGFYILSFTRLFESLMP